MNLFSLLKKRNYTFLYHSIKPYVRSVKNEKKDYTNYSSLVSLSEYFEFHKYKKIIVVASGPSAADMILEEDALYFCCNDSIKIVKSKPHIYIVHDQFYLVKYLKSFNSTNNWLGTLFWIYDNKSKINYNSFKKVLNYITIKSRERREFLITNFNYSKSSESLNLDLVEALQNDFNFTYKSINSGFNTLLVASVFALKNKKVLEIYGLDMGIGGDKYYNKNAVIGKSIKGDNNREIVINFLSNLYKKDMKIYNRSNFMTYKS